MKSNEHFDFINNNLEEITSAATHKNFLGREFLTWLWFFAESEEGRFVVELEGKNKNKRDAQVWVDDRLVLSSKVGRSHEHVIKGGTPGQCQEAALALRHGKSVREMRISLEIDDVGMFSLTLTGDDLSPKNIHLPEIREDIDDSPLEQRVRLTSVLSKVIDQLLIKFMDERSSKVWETERLESIRNWIKTRTLNRDELIH